MDYEPITITLDAHEAELIQELGRMRGLDEPVEVLRALLIEAYDAWWDKTFEESQDLLDKMAEEVRQQERDGLTEDWDPENDPDADDL